MLFRSGSKAEPNPMRKLLFLSAWWRSFQTWCSGLRRFEVKCYRRGPVPELTPEQVLRTKWKKLTCEQLTRYLWRVLVGERKCMTGDYPRWLRLRFKWRRLTVAERLRKLGGAVSPLVFTQPHARCWSSGQSPRPNVPMKYPWPSVFTLAPVKPVLISE